MIASVSGARYAIIVTEPTVSGLHDLLRVFDLTRHFRVPAGVLVNKADLNADMTRRIEDAARQAHADVLGTVPYDTAFTEAQIQRQTLLEYSTGLAAEAVRSAWQEVSQVVRALATR